MALVNQAKREINAKLVFYGPGLSGKSTNLKHVHSKLRPEFRGAMKVMSVQEARMLFFDFTPPGDGNVLGYRVRFHVYTVSGEVVEPAAWKMVLKGVDGLVFVADVAPGRAAANRESLDNLDAFLKGYGQSLSSVPLVFQYNKSDLPDAVAQQDLDRLLNPSRLPSFQASSQSGEGVLQTLLALVKAVLNELRTKGLEGVAGTDTLQGLMETPEAAAGSTGAAAPGEGGGDAAGAGPDEPLTLELGGTARPLAGGKIEVPLTIRCGARTKSVLLTLALSLDEE
ncbi:hypothetical protein GMLC_02130 [Geomonas limicola]|uniref:GTP-binding protein n=1 Tax=Geomonas limicola TaxID=2740186 RepID=A0A6V8N3S9_9BACT|nr:GTPase domain-containing protein [Geomonas limicola]GFO66634.1 hypothetical protein GMLC_02130 [Geomonas limicola]